MIAEILVLIILSILITILLFVYRGFSGEKSVRISAETNLPAEGFPASAPGGHFRKVGSRPSGLPCPLCGAILMKGQTVHTHVYRSGSDRLSHIFGCPYCIPEERRHTIDPRQPGERHTASSRSSGSGTREVCRRRICPVCRKDIPEDGYLVARMFEKQIPAPDGRMKKKTHVHVLGCTGCRVRRR